MSRTVQVSVMALVLAAGLSAPAFAQATTSQEPPKAQLDRVINGQIQLGNVW